jgi:L-iditol 2-dehydrogenase
MKQLQLLATRCVDVADVPAPSKVGPEDILIRIKAIGICGSDLHYYRGDPAGNAPLVYPFIMGHEFAGVVEAVGSRVATVHPGDRVAVDPAVPCGHCEFCLEGNPNLCPRVRFAGSPGVGGAMQDLLVWPARTAFTLPNDMTFVQGAVLEPLGVALHAIGLAKLAVADTVAILGCGPIGLIIAQLAHLSGAQDVFVSEVVEHRLHMAERQGVSLAINARRQDPVKAIMEATRGRGVDVAIEVAGVVETAEQAAEVCKPGGTVVIVGICGEDRMDFRAGITRRRGLTIKVARRMKHVYHRTIALARRHMVDIDTLVTHTLPLEQGAEAFRILADYQDDVGKVVLVNE